MKAPRKIWLIGFGILLVAIACYFIVPEFQFRSDLRKFRVSATADSIERDYGMHLDLQRSGNILPEPASEDMLRHHPAFYIRTSCAEVTFNDYREVIGVRRRTPILRLLWRINPDWAARRR